MDHNITITMSDDESFESTDFEFVVSTEKYKQFKKLVQNASRNDKPTEPVIRNFLAACVKPEQKDALVTLLRDEENHLDLPDMMLGTVLEEIQSGAKLVAKKR